MAQQHTRTAGIVMLLLLAADLAMVLFVFPVSCMGMFAAGALLPRLAAWIRTAYDPVNDIWEFTPMSAKSFHWWANRVCDRKRYGLSKERFLKLHRMPVGMKVGVLISQSKAWIYVHAVPLLVSVLLGLLVYDFYQVVAGHTVVWTNPMTTGAAMGAVWGFCLGLFLAWRTGARLRKQAEQAAAAL